jgi:hypothetical protein
MLTHPHTRSDYPQPTSPRIPQRPAAQSRIKCSPAIERRIRFILAWQSGTCGLITAEAVELIGTMYLDGIVAIGDLRRLAHPPVYAVILQWIADERERLAEVRRVQAEDDAAVAAARKSNVWRGR